MGDSRDFSVNLPIQPIYDFRNFEKTTYLQKSFIGKSP